MGITSIPSSLTNKHEFGTVFFVDSKVYHFVERLCILRVKGQFLNYYLINIHAPTNDSEEEVKD
jgi:hypothetical protein